MTIAVLPALLESIATGSVLVVAGMAAWYLFKHDVLNKKTSHPEHETPSDRITSAPPPLKETPPQMDIAKTEPAPIVAEKVIEPEPLPEEAMLRRHYLHSIRCMVMATTFPCPTDSMLSRHYDGMIDAKAEECLEDDAKMARLEAEYEALQFQSSEETFAEEPMLRRHYLNNIRQMLMAVTFPRPTDSALSRHYDGMIDAKAEECLEDDAKMARLEAEYEALQSQSSEETFAEEPMLRRHYLNNIRQMLIAVTFPRPTDSALSRHYDDMIDAKAEECLENEAKMARLEAEYEALQKVRTLQAVSTGCADIVPEDSMLRRHFLSMIRSKIEAMKGPRPTDSALYRHYMTMINMEMDNYLATH